MTHSTIISPEMLTQHVEDPEWIVFDCRFSLEDTERGRRSYRDGHVPNAYYAHLDHDLAAPRGAGTGRHPLPDIDRFAAWLGRHGVGEGKQVVSYDDSGGAFAARLWWMLRWLGHDTAAVLDGGWDAWTGAGLPVNQDIRSPVQSAFTPRANHSLWVDADQLIDGMDAGASLVVDARSPERYAGEKEPLDAVAGHIPGAVNLYHMDNLAPDRRFESPGAIRRRFEALLAGRGAAAVVHSCGSGVTACHNLLAMEIAGLSGSKLYPGSWSDWITDPARPIATGRSP